MNWYHILQHAATMWLCFGMLSLFFSRSENEAFNAVFTIIVFIVVKVFLWAEYQQKKENLLESYRTCPIEKLEQEIEKWLQLSETENNPGKRAEIMELRRQAWEILMTRISPQEKQ